MVPRYEVIGIWPGGDMIVGQIIMQAIENETVWRVFDEQRWQTQTVHNPEKYPYLFKKLEWWQHRTIEQMNAIRYAKVTKYVGYWREGDIVPVRRFEVGSIQRATPYGLILEYDHYHPVFNVTPATEQEYREFEKKEFPHRKQPTEYINQNKIVK